MHEVGKRECRRLPSQRVQVGTACREGECDMCPGGLCWLWVGLGGCDLDPVLYIRVLLVFLVILALLEKVALG